MLFLVLVIFFFLKNYYLDLIVDLIVIRDFLVFGMLFFINKRLCFVLILMIDKFCIVMCFLFMCFGNNLFLNMWFGVIGFIEFG